jgi:hypothetical protein
VADKTFDKLLEEISDEDFVRYQLPGRIRCDELDVFIENHKPDLRTDEGKRTFRQFIEPIIPEAQQFIDELIDFIYIKAKLPSGEKNYITTEPIEISTDFNREQVIDYLQNIRKDNPTADLAFYAYRDMESCRWEPFIKAAIERNPVSLEKAKGMSPEEVYTWLEQMNGSSIYDGKRLAQPDEAVNYKTGDGFEKAFTLANIIRQRNPENNIEIISEKNQVIVKGQKEYRFETTKKIEKHINITSSENIIIED